MNAIAFSRREETGRERISLEFMKEFIALLSEILLLQANSSLMYFPLSIAPKSCPMKSW
jgi:hypothetical protein